VSDDGDMRLPPDHVAGYNGRALGAIGVAVVVMFLVAVALLLLESCGGHSTRLSPLDTRALSNQEAACETIATRADSGPVVSLAEACYCGARGILRRAHKPYDDAGACP